MTVDQATGAQTTPAPKRGGHSDDTLERFRRTFYDTEVAMVIAGGPEGLISDFNPRFCQLLGRSPKETYGVAFLDLVHEDDRAKCLADIGACLEGKQNGFRDTKRMQRPDGSSVWLDMTTTCVRDADGTPLNFTTQAIDVTAQRIAEIERDRSYADLHRFASVVAHDLQGPLRTIAGLTEVLTSELHEHMTAEQRTYASYITAGATTLQQLVGDLLKYARIDSEPHSPAPVSVSAALEQVLHLLAHDLEEAGAQVTIGLDVDELQIDPTHLNQILLNVLQNSLRYRNRDLQLRIDIFTRPIGTGGVELRICDNGVGIAPELHGSIFEMGRKGKDSPGSGIGLTAVKRAAERNHGTVWVESEGHSGTDIVFAFQRPV